MGNIDSAKPIILTGNSTETDRQEFEKALKDMGASAYIFLPPLPQRYFFAQDDDCHWYMIPADRREEWQNAGHLNLDTDEGYEAWIKGGWENYRTGGGISDIEFLIENDFK